MQQGGGIGHDFSTLRPKGALVKSIGADASGPVSFMDVWDAMCRTIMSAGARRGAHDGDAALRPSRHRGLHRRQGRPGAPAQFQSVGAGDGRLHRAPCATARRGTSSFDGKVYRTVEARALWDRMMRATYDYAEPGVVFIDRINAAEQPRLLRGDQRHEPVRRAAAAAPRRLPAGLDQPRPPGRQAVHGRGAARSGAARGADGDGRALPRQRHRHLRTIRCRRRRRRPRPSAASASASPGSPTP